MILALILHADPLGLLVAFGAGMLSFISPCVLPMVPGYLSMVSGLSAAQLSALASPADPDATVSSDAGDVMVRVSPPIRDIRSERSALLRGILFFIAGFTVVFVILGATASALGRLLLVHKGALTTLSGILIVIFGAMLISMALGIRLPTFVQGERRIPIRPSTLGAWAPPLMGMAFAFAWTPCVSPVLGSVMTLAAGSGGSAMGGIALLLAYSLGLGVPFLLFGVAFGRMTDLVARVRGGLRYADAIGGAILMLFGILLLTGNVPVVSHEVSAWLADLHLTWLGNV